MANAKNKHIVKEEDHAQSVPVKITGSNSFEISVMKAARKQATQILNEAKAQSEALYSSILAQDNGDPVKAHETELTSVLRRSVANMKQENLKKLIIYRKQLVNGLFAECSEQLVNFTCTNEYADFLKNTIDPFLEEACNLKEKCTVLMCPTDEIAKKTVAKILPNASVKTNAQIKIGGIQIIIGRILHDETLDTRLLNHRKDFLLHCELHIDAIGLEPS